MFLRFSEYTVNGSSLRPDRVHGSLSFIVLSCHLDHVRRHVRIENNVQYESKFRAHVSSSSLVTPESPFCQTSFTQSSRTGGVVVHHTAQSLASHPGLAIFQKRNAQCVCCWFLPGIDRFKLAFARNLTHCISRVRFCCPPLPCLAAQPYNYTGRSNVPSPSHPVLTSTPLIRCSRAHLCNMVFK